MADVRTTQVALEAMLQSDGARVSQVALEVMIGDLPDTPANVAAVAQSASSILVTWDDGDNETGYRIERRRCL